VLSVNYRGSTGFGKAFVNAANLEWAGKMHDDLLDAVDWAVAKGIADPARVAIMGGSYGGYPAAVGGTFTPAQIALPPAHAGDFQRDALPEHDPGLLDAVEIDLEGPHGRLPQRCGAPLPRGTIAAQLRRSHRAPAADRPGGERSARKSLGVRADRRRPAETRHSRDLCLLPRRRPRLPPAGEPPLLQCGRRSVPGQPSRRTPPPPPP